MIALIPTIGEATQLHDLVDQLLEEGVEEVILTVNDPAARVRFFDHRVVVVRLHGSIYAGWNFGINYGRASSGASRTSTGHIVALLNDDLELAPGALEAAARMMLDERDAVVVGLDYRADSPELPSGLLNVQGTYRHGGVHGCALLVDAKRTQLVDEQFEWWYGDDDLVFSVMADGCGVYLAEGCRVRHQGEATASNHPWTHEAKIRDRERFVEKWGDR